MGLSAVIAVPLGTIPLVADHSDSLFGQVLREMKMPPKSCGSIAFSTRVVTAAEIQKLHGLCCVFEMCFRTPHGQIDPEPRAIEMKFCNGTRAWGRDGKSD
jgi:hypothetical protein